VVSCKHGSVLAFDVTSEPGDGSRREQARGSKLASRTQRPEYGHTPPASRIFRGELSIVCWLKPGFEKTTALSCQIVGEFKVL
jgi:hypothetical protein